MKGLALATPILAALAGPAHADQIDYLINFPSEAAAEADPVVGAYRSPPDNEGDLGGTAAMRR